jgi:putative peptidoglycan lipid II flippase
LLRRLFAEGSLTIAFIPVFTEYLTLRTKQDAFELARIVLTLLSVITALMALCGVILSPWIVRIQAFGFGGSGIKYELTVLLTRITFPYIFFISLVAFFMGVLNSLKHFAAPAAAPIFLNIGIIGAALFISPHCPEPIVGVAIGVIIGGFLQVLLQIPPVLREGVRLFPCWQLGHPALKRIGILMLPAVFGSAVYQLNQFVGTLLASFLPEGSVSWLYYADRLVQFPLGVFAIAISTAALPSLSIQAAEKNLDRFSETVAHAMRLVVFVSLPSMVGLMILGTPIIQVLFERGAFDPNATAMTKDALFFYAVGLWAFSGIRVMVSGFYAVQDTKTPVKVAIIAVLANLIISLLLMKPLKHSGLALALSLASTLQFCLLVFFLKRKTRISHFKAVLISSAKCALAAAVMGCGVYLVHTFWLFTEPGQDLLDHALRLLALLAVAVIFYFGMARILGCEELSAIMDVFRPLLRRFGKGR